MFAAVIVEAVVVEVVKAHQADASGREPVVRRVKPGLPGSAELHEECDEGKDDDDEGQDESREHGGHGNLVAVVLAPGSPVPDRARADPGAAVDGLVGQSSGRNGQSESDDNSQWNGPFVHSEKSLYDRV